MKKLILLFAVLVMAVGFNSYAFEIAPMLSGNFVKDKVDPAPDPAASAKMALGFGVKGAFTLMPNLDLETGLFYSPVADKTEATTAGVTVTTLNSRNYLRVPVMAKYYVMPMVSLGAGLYYGMGMGDIKTKIDMTGAVTSSNEQTTTWTEKKSELGLMLGAGGKFPVGTMNVVADFNYIMGLSNNNTSTVERTVKTSGFQVLAGVSFPM